MTTAKDEPRRDAQRFHLKDAGTSGDAFVFTRQESIVFALAAALFVVARLWRLTVWSLCYDEAASLTAARLDWSGLLAFAADDIVHPPLFYALLKVWMAAGGESLFWLRLLPPLVSILSLVPFYLLCRELKLRVAEMNLALVLMASNAYLIYYAEEIRMYSLLMLLALASSWLFVRFFNSRGGDGGDGGDSDGGRSEARRLLALFAVNLLLVYTHYYGWLLVAAEAVFLLRWSRRKLKWFVVSVVLLVICFSPWVYAVARAAHSKQGLGTNIGWIKRPGLVALAIYYAVLHGAFNVRNAHGDFRWLTVPGTLIFSYPVVKFVRHVVRERASGAGEQRMILDTWLLTFFALPVALAFAASYVLPQAIWHPRYLIITAAPYMLLVAVAVYRLQPSRVRKNVLRLVVGWALTVGMIELLADKKPWCGHDRLTRQAVDSKQYLPDVLKAK